MANEGINSTENEYLLLYDEEDANFLKKYVTLLKNGVGKIGLLHHDHKYLVDLLVKIPYPTLQLLLLNFDKSNFYIIKAISAALKLLISENENEFSPNFISFITNFPDIVLEANSLRQNLLDLLIKRPFDKNLGIALLCRDTSTLLGAVLNYWKQLLPTDQTLLSKEFIIYQVIECQKHFLPILVKDLKDISLISDATIRNILIISKLCNEFSNQTQKISELQNINKLLAKFNLNESPSELTEKHKFFYIEFFRYAEIINFLANYPTVFDKLQVHDVIKATSVIELISEYGIKARFENVRKTMESIYQIQQNEPGPKKLFELESETLVHYSILEIITEFTFLETTTAINQEFYKRQVQQLNTLLRQLQKIEVVCQIIRDIFKILFMRWEDIKTKAEFPNHHKLKSGKITKFHLSRSTEYIETEVDAKYRLKSSKVLKGNARCGFICQAPVFHEILLQLKKFVTKKLHSEDFKKSEENIKKEFQSITENISELLWKYAIIEKIEKSLTDYDKPKTCLDEKDIIKLVRLHEESIDTSEDDNFYSCNDLTFLRRHVLHKRRRATFSSDIITDGENLTSRSKNDIIDAKYDDSTAKKIKITSNGNRKTNSLISKMLGSPENILNLALTYNKSNEAKSVIEHYNLQNTEIDREVCFIEHQKQVKEKLLKIYGNFKKLDNCTRNTNEPIPTVEQIKSVAAKGFEVSKIISIVDNFARSHPIQQSPELKQLLAKHAHNRYPFLHLFEADNLNAFVITDLIIDLPLNREITSNIIKVIKRQQQMSADISSGPQTDGTEHKEISSLPCEIGPMIFLENLCECLRLMEQSNQDKQFSMTLFDLLHNNFCSLKPKKLAAELQRKRSFEAIFYKSHEEISRYDDVRAYGSLIQNVVTTNNFYGRLLNYVGHLTKLLKLRYPNLEFHTTELLKTDPYSVIGDLIFDLNMTPLEIEKEANSLNLNLTHLIAINICPQIADKPIFTKGRIVAEDKQNTIYNYIGCQSALLAYLLKSINRIEHLSESDTMNGEFLERYMDLPEIKKLAALYNGNLLIAALRSDSIKLSEIDQIDSKMVQLEILLTYRGNEEFAKLRQNKIDQTVIELIKINPKNILFAKLIFDISLRAEIIQEYFMKIPTAELAQELIELTLTHKEAPTKISFDLLVKLENTLKNIKIYSNVSNVMQLETWTQAYDFGLKTPNTIFDNLLCLKMYKLCFDWSEAISLQKYFNQNKRLLLSTLLTALLKLQDTTEQDVLDPHLIKLIEMFPLPDCIWFFGENKDAFRSVALLEYSIEFLTQQDSTNYKNYKVSLKIFKELKVTERVQFWNLVKYPLLIIEQLIMNAKFEILLRVLKAVRQYLDLEGSPSCSFCCDKRGNIYDIHSKTNQQKLHFQLGGDNAHSAFILLNFNLYQIDHLITNECIDLLLRIYATKALDYYVSSNVDSLSDRNSQTTDMQSLDSLCDTFQLPKQAPSRDGWIRDKDASHCMCCRRAAFTMLMRRHHCRRCGRVVCFACSLHRAIIPELYAELPVRICNDCHQSLEEPIQNTATAELAIPEVRDSFVHLSENDYKWELSGIITHDKLLREEFCYDHAPSVALCLSILEYHMDQQKCVDLLLYHCRKLEKLIVPNPEVDYEVVAKMMNCLALAAKVRGAPAEVEKIREHSEIIMAVVQNGCSALIPPDPLNNNNLRKLADSLVQAEHWKLALEVHLKFGFSTTGVMAAQGLSCLRAGVYELAREKVSHCMTKLSNEQINSNITKCIFSLNKIQTDKNEPEIIRNYDIPFVKRPKRGPPLLKEILSIIKSLPIIKPQPETMQRASLIRSSNTSLASLFTRRKDQYAVPLHEPALNILTRLANLKNITNGQYCEAGIRHMNVVDYNETEKEKVRQTRNFDESLKYVLTYGSHTDILSFLMAHYELSAALRYYLLQNIDAEYFINNIYLKLLSCSHIPDLIKKMQDISENKLLIWRKTILQTCRYLETNNLLNSLYNLQILINDPVRASMTCVKFYSMNCENFRQLHANSDHLHNAHKHLQAELEKFQWELVKFDSSILSGLRKKSFSDNNRRSSAVSTCTQVSATSIPMQLDARTLNSHINTILKQLEVAKFLSKCEAENCAENDRITEKILKQIRIESDKSVLPTLFEGIQDKIQICILILYCGKNIDEGFGLAYRIIQDYKIPPIKVYAATAKYLASNERLSDVEKLLNCITSNNDTCSDDIDQVISVAIHSAVNTHESAVKTTLDYLTKKIQDIEMRISAHIFIGQLKTAYLLANKNERLGDIRKILRQAEILNQIHIKKLCEKKLNINASSTAS